MAGGQGWQAAQLAVFVQVVRVINTPPKGIIHSLCLIFMSYCTVHA